MAGDCSCVSYGPAQGDDWHPPDLPSSYSKTFVIDISSDYALKKILGQIVFVNTLFNILK